MKVLLTTRFRSKEFGYYDYFESNQPTLLRFSSPRKVSFGLRFLKQNLPELEILEYPTWDQYVSKLKEGWDVVGFSFFADEIPEIIRMAKYARKMGIPELWAGNYGALSEGIEEHVDRIFVGYAEDQIAKILGRKIRRLVHPPIIGPLSTSFGIHLNYSGVLFTNRGCPIGCTFCQTPAFAPKPSKIPIESIERVLKYYRDCGIRDVVILDETFFLFRNHGQKVVDLLHKYGFSWSAMTRSERIVRNFDDWIDKGFFGGFIGIESFDQETLDAIGKKKEIGESLEAIQLMKEHNLYTIGYYIIGFEKDTESSIKRDIETLAKLRLGYTQLCILTPLPRTPQWQDIEERYGIFEKDWRKWDTKHLVWNHPNLKPRRIEELLQWGFRKVNPPSQLVRNMFILNRRYHKLEGKFFGGWRRMLRQQFRAHRFDYDSVGFFPENGYDLEMDAKLTTETARTTDARESPGA